MNIRTTALALLAALALLGAGCGQASQKGKPIPPGVATTLQHRLDVIQSQFNAGAGACSDILDKTRPVVEQDLQRVPSSVDPGVRKALQTSFDHLFDLVTSQCRSNTNTNTNTTPTNTNTTPTDTNTTPTNTNTTPTDTNTTPTTTNTTPTNQPPGQQKKPKKQNGNGNGNGGGNGGGPAAPGTGG
jgi:hypothetical protein